MCYTAIATACHKQCSRRLLFKSVPFLLLSCHFHTFPTTLYKSSNLVPFTITRYDHRGYVNISQHQRCMLKTELDLVLFTVTRKSYYDAIDTKNSIFSKIGVGSFYRINVQFIVQAYSSLSPNIGKYMLFHSTNLVIYREFLETSPLYISGHMTIEHDVRRRQCQRVQKQKNRLIYL